MKKLELAIIFLALVAVLYVHAVQRPTASIPTAGATYQVIAGTMVITSAIDVSTTTGVATFTPSIILDGTNGKVTAAEVTASTFTGSFVGSLDGNAATASSADSATTASSATYSNNAASATYASAATNSTNAQYSSNLSIAGSVKWTQTSALDFSAGTGLGIDTSTYSGSVAIDVSTSTHLSQMSVDSYLALCDELVAAGYQAITPSSTINVKSLTLLIDYEGIEEPYPTITGNVRLVTTQPATPTDAFVTLATGSVSCPVVADHTYYYHNVVFNNVATLQSGTTYYLLFTDFTMDTFSKASTDLTKGSTFYYWQGETSQWGTQSRTVFFVLYDINLTASYVSQPLQASDWSDWTVINISSSVPPNSSIQLYVQTSTASDNLSSRPGISVINGTSLSGIPGPYIHLVASYTRTTSSSVPKLDEFSINYGLSKWVTGTDLVGNKSNYAVGITTPSYLKEWFIDDNFSLWIGTGTDNAGQWVEK